ncbi:MAG: sigma-70 family RNA polymerase sigma factor [Burkholderiales bacterium]
MVDRTRFEKLTLPYLDATLNLARWLTRNDQDAYDVVQDAYLRAFKFFDGFDGDNARVWLLAIVRNACFDWMTRNSRKEMVAVDNFEEFIETTFTAEEDQTNPLAILVEKSTTALVQQSKESLPMVYREALVMHAIEGLSYKEIAFIANIPLGTVMSRLARARALMRTELQQKFKEKI